jgi:group II intron reverse transcriptase/maturase
VKRVEIPKPDGGMRMLGIPTVIDRVIQQAILQQLTPIFDPGFSTSSYGFRPGRSAHDAIRQARKYMEEGYFIVVDIDLEKFFDRVNHDMLMARVARKVSDKSVLRLIRRYLDAGVMRNGVCIANEEGVPQGGPLSPLLANIILDDLDKELERRGHRFCRYADDCNVYVKGRKSGERVKESLTRFIRDKLKLKVNEEKSAVDRPSNRKFLGFSFIRLGFGVKICIAPKAIKKLKDRIRFYTRPQ